jgi:type I restriction enzyme, S subunit
MDARQFLAEFRHIANAPEGVQRLRELIYNLAITGDLTEQRPADGNAQTLLEAIEQERQRRIKAKVFKRAAKLESAPLVIPANIRLPESWRWTRLLDIGEIGPRNEAKDESVAAFISMSGISQLHNGKLVSESRNWGDIKKGFTHFANGDIVVAKITPCFENGKAAVISGLANDLGIGAGTTELHVFRPIHSDVHPGYIYIFLRSPFFAVEGERNMTGTAGQMRLPTEYFATRALPLPPYTEQSRIVAKVDELMALCDKLETQRQERTKLEASTRKAVLRELSSVDAVSVSSGWERLDRNLDCLFGTPESVDDFEASLKELAVRGVLTPVTAIVPDIPSILQACTELKGQIHCR